jgi:hypothetical protein
MNDAIDLPAELFTDPKFFREALSGVSELEMLIFEHALGSAIHAYAVNTGSVVYGVPLHLAGSLLAVALGWGVEGGARWFGTPLATIDYRLEGLDEHGGRSGEEFLLSIPVETPVNVTDLEVTRERILGHLLRTVTSRGEALFVERERWASKIASDNGKMVNAAQRNEFFKRRDRGEFDNLSQGEVAQRFTIGGEKITSRNIQAWNKQRAHELLKKGMAPQEVIKYLHRTQPETLEMWSQRLLRKQHR